MINDQKLISANVISNPLIKQIAFILEEHLSKFILKRKNDGYNIRYHTEGINNEKTIIDAILFQPMFNNAHMDNRMSSLFYLVNCIKTAINRNSENECLDFTFDYGGTEYATEACDDYDFIIYPVYYK